ncbi:hypothetical protein [Bartonella elizabethae]|uniref:hypothetical protein n=1 Tax=Bartonella elizabethae TaxID=807 RepID=UPI00047EC524|nr:hypothetical protein [Bartonella elizabethae]
MTSGNTLQKKLTDTYKKRKKRKKKKSLHIEEIQRASDTANDIVENQSIKIIADFLPRKTVHYAVSAQEIKLLKSFATSARRYEAIMGTLGGACLTLFTELFEDTNHLKIKLILMVILFIILVFLFFYSRKYKSQSEEIWENIKKESGQ